MNLNPTVAGSGDGATVRTGGPLVVGYSTNATVGIATVNCGSVTINNGFLTNDTSANVFANYYYNIAVPTTVYAANIPWTLNGTDSLGSMSTGTWACSVSGIYSITLTVVGANTGSPQTINLKLNSTTINPSIYIQDSSFGLGLFYYFNGSATCTVYIAAGNTITANVPGNGGTGVLFYGNGVDIFNTLSFTRIC